LDPVNRLKHLTKKGLTKDASSGEIDETKIIEVVDRDEIPGMLQHLTWTLWISALELYEKQPPPMPRKKNTGRKDAAIVVGNKVICPTIVQTNKPKHK